MNPTTVNSNDVSLLIYNWILTKLLYFACFILTFLGAAFASVFSDNKAKLPFWKQVFSLFFSVILIGLIVGYLLKNYTIDPYVMGFLSATLGMGARQLSAWLLALWQKSEGFEDLARKLARIAGAVRSIMREDAPHENNNPNPESTDDNPTN